MLNLAPRMPVPVNVLRMANRPASLLADAMARCMQDAVRQTLVDCGLCEPA